MADDLSRRQFFRLTPVDYLKSTRRAELSSSVEVELVRPPGALADEQQFLQACERCGECAKACPHDVIAHLGPAWGSAENTPYLDPQANPCHWCTSMDCIAACPSGALARQDGKAVGAIAKAKLNPEQCLNSEGILCDTCVQYCPSEANAIRMEQRMPQLDQDRCVGCGLCAYFCDAVPSAIDVVATRRVHAQEK